MSFISESKLYEYSSRKGIYTKDNIIQLNESIYRDSSKPMVFLSHKHDEDVILQGVISFLKEEGADVYVDWMDESMPSHTNSETALKLKEKIKVSNKFILVATANAIESKWCNWELGFGDAYKFKEHIALFPIDKANRSFNGSEYLNIYPYVDYQNGQNTYSDGTLIKKGYYIRSYSPIESIITPLAHWLRT